MRVRRTTGGSGLETLADGEVGRCGGGGGRWSLYGPDSWSFDCPTSSEVECPNISLSKVSASEGCIKWYWTVPPGPEGAPKDPTYTVTRNVMPCRWGKRLVRSGVVEIPCGRVSRAERLVKIMWRWPPTRSMRCLSYYVVCLLPPAAADPHIVVGNAGYM